MNVRVRCLSAFLVCSVIYATGCGTTLNTTKQPLPNQTSGADVAKTPFFSAYEVKTNGQTYEIYPGQTTDHAVQQMIQVVNTPYGAVWNPIPAMSSPVNDNMKADVHPTAPFTLYLSNTSSNTLDTATSKPLFSLPLTVSQGNEKNLHVFLRGLYNSGNFVFCNEDVRSTKSFEPVFSQLTSLDLRTHKVRNITQFHTNGGTHFYFAVVGNTLYYKQTTGNAHAKYVSKYHKVNLDTGSTKSLLTPPNHLKWQEL